MKLIMWKLKIHKWIFAGGLLVRRVAMAWATTIVFLALIPLTAKAQGAADYERLDVADARHILVGMAMSPDMEHIAISGSQSHPMYIYNWKNRAVTKEFDVGNWYAGSRVNYSKNGKYILLQQLYYIDFAPNNDREVNFEVIDAHSGKVVIRFADYHSVAFTPDEKQVITLTGNEVAFYNLETGNKERSFIVPMASNGVAISPDMKYIAVSHHLDKKKLKKHPAMKNKKGKVVKRTAKYKQQISIFDANAFEKLYTVNEFYDIVYKLRYSPDGKYLFCMHIPHIKAQSGLQRLTYINTIDAASGEPLRLGFTSSAPYEPEFKLSHNDELFAIVSQGHRFVELHVYDFKTGNMIDRFEQSFRLFEKADGEMVMVDSRASFVFMPDDKSILMTMGNKLIHWNLKLNQ